MREIKAKPLLFTGYARMLNAGESTIKCRPQDKGISMGTISNDAIVAFPSQERTSRDTASFSILIDDFRNNWIGNDAKSLLD